MLNNIIKFSLNNRFFVLLSAFVLVVVGIRTAMDMDVDVFPDLDGPDRGCYDGCTWHGLGGGRTVGHLPH